YYLHARREAWLDLLQLGLHAIDYGKYVLSLTDHDNAGHGISFAVPVGDSTAQVRAEGHVADVLHANRSSGRGRGQDYAPKIVGRLSVAAAANHILSAAGLDKPSPNVVVSRAHRLDHFHDGNLKRL